MGSFFRHCLPRSLPLWDPTPCTLLRLPAQSGTPDCPPPQTPRRCVPDISEPRLQRFPDPAPGLAGGGGAGSGVHCMAVLPPSLSSSGALEVRVQVLFLGFVSESHEVWPLAERQAWQSSRVGGGSDSADNQGQFSAWRPGSCRLLTVEPEGCPPSSPSALPPRPRALD